MTSIEGLRHVFTCGFEHKNAPRPILISAQNRASIFKRADKSRQELLDVPGDDVRNEARFDDHASVGLVSGGRATRISGGDDVDSQRRHTYKSR